MDPTLGYCARFHHAIELLGRRWTGVIVRELLRKDQRFSDLRAAVPGLSDRLLTERLRELECEGILTRFNRSASSTMRYSLTPKGRALGPILAAVATWAAEWLDETAPGQMAPSAT